MNKVGRPPMFKSAPEMQEKIDLYFKEGVTKRTIVVGPANNRRVEVIPVPTITGLCYYLGFESRQSFYAYEDKPEFSYTVRKARLFIEKEYEEILATTGNTGAIFALKNFGWVDSQKIDHTVQAMKPILGGTSVYRDDSDQESKELKEAN